MQGVKSQILCTQYQLTPHFKPILIMKTILSKFGILTICTALLFANLFLIESCKDLPIPDPSHYLIIKKKGEHSDFFVGNSHYSLDTAQWFNNHGYSGKLGFKFLSGFNRILWDANTEKNLYIDFKNGDIDTLTQVWTPRPQLQM